MGPPKVCSLLHGVFMGVYLFEMLTLCSPKFQGRYYRLPSFVPRVPPFVTGFSTNFLSLYLKKSQYCVFFDVAIRKVLGAFRANSFAFRAYFPAFPICNPESLECFPDTFVGFPALPCVFWYLYLFCWKTFSSLKGDGYADPYLVGKFFQNEMKKIKSPPRPRPLAEFPFPAQILS